MRPIVKILFGSHLYGTDTPESDRDYKGVFIPNRRDIILGKPPRIINLSSNKTHEKNNASDVDMEWFSVAEYLEQLCQGQTFALDMLFAPGMFFELDDIDTESLSVWFKIKQLREHFIHKGVASYVGYCRTQAAKYGIKGSRMAALKTAINFLKGKDQDARLNDFWDEIEALSQENEHMDIVQTSPKRADLAGIMLDNWEVSNRKMTRTVRVEYALNVFQEIYEKYGERARKAERNEGIDWKALSHAIRVCGEAEELLKTGNITFPRPDRGLLLAVKEGRFPYKEVAALIETGLNRVERAQDASTLRETPDHKFKEELIFDIHLKQITGEKQ